MSQLDFPQTVQLEFNDLMLGPYLGGGVARKVYVFAPDPTKVVKLEMTQRQFQNVSEWQLWDETQWGVHQELRRWLAPCFFISHSGSVLIQGRTYPLHQMPAEVPTIFTDLKPCNWGAYEGHPVAHDYGRNMVMPRGLNGGRRLKKAEWHT